MRSGFLSKIKMEIIKSGIIKTGKIPRKVKFGIFKEIFFLLDYKCQTQLYFGLWEKEIYKFVKELSKGIITAIDVGAGEGEYTLYFLKKTSAKKIFACEPDQDCRKILINNVKLNYPNYPLKDRKLELVSRPIGIASESKCALDSLVTSIETPCLIKVDIEGEEMDLLRGAETLLKQPQIRWIIETHSKKLEKQCMQILRQEGYITRIAASAWWRLFIPEERPISYNSWIVAVPINK